MPLSAQPSGGGDKVARVADDLLGQFVRPDFDSTAFIRVAVRNDSVSDDLAHLRQGISVLENQLREQVVSHHARLIEQVSHAKDLETLVNTVSTGVANLQGSLNKVKVAIKDPYVQLKTKTTQLDRLQQAGEVLRRVIRVRELSDKLRKHMQQVDDRDSRTVLKELGQAALCLFEIKSSLILSDLSNVDAIDRLRGWINDVDKRIQDKAFDALSDAVLRRQQPEIGSALQVFLHLDMLPSAVEKLIGSLLKLASAAVKEALDTATLPIEAEDGKSRVALAAAKAKGPSSNDAGAWKTALWSRVEALMDTLLGKCAQVWTLHRVLCKKRDAQTQTLLLEMISPTYRGEDIRFFRSFWSRLMASIGKQLLASSDQSSFVKGMLTTDYPKLRATFVEMWTTAHKDTDAGASGAVGDAERGAMLAALEPFLQQYLSKTLTRLNDGVGVLFTAKPASGPQPSDVSTFQKSMTQVAQSSKGDPQLAHALANLVEKCVKLLESKCKEGHSPSDPEARSLSGVPTGTQLKTFAIYNAAIQIHGTLQALESAASKAACSAASKVYKELMTSMEALCGELLLPLFNGLESTLRADLGNMHACRFEVEEGEGNEFEECSAYMLRTVRDIDTFVTKYASRLSPSKPLDAAKAKLAERTLRLFVRHAVLVRPLTEMVKMRLIRDMTKLEETAGRLANLKHLESAYAALRGLRPLLFVEDDPPADLVSRIRKVDAFSDISESDRLHHLVQRLPMTVKFISSEPAGASREQHIQAYSSELDKEGHIFAARRVLEALVAAGIDMQAQGFPRDVLTFAKAMQESS